VPRLTLHRRFWDRAREKQAEHETGIRRDGDREGGVSGRGVGGKGGEQGAEGKRETDVGAGGAVAAGDAAGSVSSPAKAVATAGD